MKQQQKGFIQHPSKKVEAVALNGSIEEFKSYVEKYWLLPVHQIALLKHGMEEKRDLYLSIRRPCADFVWEVLTTNTEDMDLIRRTVVGCELDIDNELELASFEDAALMEEYITSNPAGPYLHPDTVEFLLESEKEEVRVIAEKYKPLENKACTTAMSGMLSTEQLAKLGL